MCFVVMCLANQTGIDLQAAFDKKMDLKSIQIKTVIKTTINLNNVILNYEYSEE
jgi:hypothetical protein